MSGNEEAVYRQDGKSAKKNTAQETTLHEPKIMSCIALNPGFPFYCLALLASWR